MDWYLIHTKPRQEKLALENLARQGYACYLPCLRREQRRAAAVVLVDEPLFPRYLFIQLDQASEAKSWGPIRSTRGVSRLVCFGKLPARVNERLIEILRQREATLDQTPVRLLNPGDRVGFTEGAFSGLEGVYQNPDGESRALVLIELLSRPQIVRVGARRLFRVA